MRNRSYSAAMARILLALFMLSVPAWGIAAEKSDLSVFRSRVNQGGVSDWRPMPPETAGDVVAAVKAPGAAGKTGRSDVVYVDEKGRPLPSGAQLGEAIEAIRREAAPGKYQDALDAAMLLLAHPQLSPSQKGDLLHQKAEYLFMQNRDDPAARFRDIVNSGIGAMNHDPEDPRNADIVLRLGYVNLRAGNIPEARGYFNRLREQYPLNDNIPLTYLYWGDWHYARGEMAEAAREYGHIMDVFPRSKPAGDAAVGLAKSWSAMGEYAKTRDTLAYVETTWPAMRFDHPETLTLAGDAAFRLGDHAFALDRYQLHYNLLPDGPDAGHTLTKMGDAALRAGCRAEAAIIYGEAARRFPGREGGIVGAMRLDELGGSDTAGVSGVFSVFPGLFSTLPAEAPAPAHFAVGKAEVVAIRDAPGVMDASRFQGADPAAIRVLEPSGRAASSLNVFLVKSEGKIILIDTGFGTDGARGGALLQALGAMGLAPENVDIVLLTHLHLDHAGGLLKGGAPAFPNAVVMVSGPERAFWTNVEETKKAPGLERNFELVRKVVQAYGPRLRTFSPGEAVAPGITAVPAKGHTPGHTAFMLTRPEGGMLFWGDAVLAASLQFARPDIFAAYDLDPVEAAASRRVLLNLAAAEGIPVAGAHLPFPGIGRVAVSGEGYGFSPGLGHSSR